MKLYVSGTKHRDFVNLDFYPAFISLNFQAISLVISSELSKDILEIQEDKKELSTIHVDCFSDSQEWTLHNFVELSSLDISAQYTRVRQTYPGLIVTCCVSRRSGFFAWNVLVIVVSKIFSPTVSSYRNFCTSEKSMQM